MTRVPLAAALPCAALASCAGSSRGAARRTPDPAPVIDAVQPGGGTTG